MTRRMGTALFRTAIIAGWMTSSPLMPAENGDTAAVLLESASQARLVDGDLVRAIRLYEQILASHGDNRAVAAEALLRLAQCREKTDATKARADYERLLRDYSDQTRPAGTARTRLSTLKPTKQSAPGKSSEDVIVREIWERPQPGQPGPTRNFVIFSDLSILRWNGQENKPETRRLNSTARSAAFAVVSPDQRSVAYLSWSGNLEEQLGPALQDRARPLAGAELRVVNINGSGDRTVYRSVSTPWLRPLVWSPDGKEILTVLEKKDGASDLALISVALGTSRVVKALNGRTPSTVGFSRDGSSIMYDLPEPRGSTLREFHLVQLQPGQRPARDQRYVVRTGAENTSSSPDQQIIHLLNRTGFGPRPGDIERVKRMGIDAYLEEQLNPERVPDPVMDAKLAEFASLRMNVQQLLERGGPAAPPGVRRRASIFEKKAMADRKAAGTARPVENNALLPVTMSARNLLLEGRPQDYEVQTARVLRAVYSERQLLEVMVDFWMNHFSVNHGDHQLTPHFEEQVIRRGALGKFEDMLMAVAKHPRMLNYLDNWRSSAPAEEIEKRIEALKPTVSDEEYLALLERKAFLAGSKGINENYARELMELHTLGVDGGYKQADIVEVAKILTGWTIVSKGILDAREDDGVFGFDPLMHIRGDKVVMGQTIPSGGVEEGEKLIRMLAHHKSTARFLATKLTRRFVADDPPPAVVEAASQAFLQSGGDIRQMLRAILSAGQFRSPEVYHSKIKKPLELVASSLRAIDAQPIEKPLIFGAMTSNRGMLAQMGERVYNYEAPDGNPDIASAWINSNALLVRLQFANSLALGRFGLLKIDLKAAEKFLIEMGLPRPTAEQIEQTRAMLEREAATGPARAGGMMMAPGAAQPETKTQISAEAIAVAAMLGSPQFQKR